MFKTEGSSSLVMVQATYNRALKTDLTQIRLYVYQNGASLSFPGAVASSWNVTGDGVSCGFPVQNPDAPSCLEGFLNLWHPLPTYDHVYLNFSVYGNIEDLPIGPRTALTHGAVDFFIWTPDNCDDGTTTYDHNVAARILSIINGDNKGYFITRTGIDTWTIEVVQQEFEVTEHYCQIIRTVNPKNKKITTTSKISYPLKAMIPLS
ncbi:MAG: hypothetical protein IH583_05000, partial [Candidatus Aminicenantes bacterium]|nr:hypothetical protein [Candidatus Aminicenantes bacterium]